MKLFLILALLAAVLAFNVYRVNDWDNCVPQKCANELQTCKNTPDCVKAFDYCVGNRCDKSDETCITFCITGQKNTEAIKLWTCYLQNCRDSPWKTWMHIRSLFFRNLKSNLTLYSIWTILNGWKMFKISLKCKRDLLLNFYYIFSLYLQIKPKDIV